MQKKFSFFTLQSLVNLIQITKQASYFKTPLYYPVYAYYSKIHSQKTGLKYMCPFLHALWVFVKM